MQLRYEYVSGIRIPVVLIPFLRIVSNLVVSLKIKPFKKILENFIDIPYSLHLIPLHEQESYFKSK